MSKYIHTINTISKTYAELKALKDASQLVAGQYYKITDFQLKWWNQSVNDISVKTSTTIEPLNVLAIAVNKFAVNAYSDLYPTDIIYYDFDAFSVFGMIIEYGAINGIKGWINRRIDTTRNIDIPFDWRHMTVNCCRPNLSSIETWDSSKVYNQYDVVKIDNKLYYCAVYVSRPSGTSPLNSDIWRQLSPYREGLTYFPTNEQWGFKVYKPDGNYLVNLPVDTSTRIQKYIFSNSDPESNQAVNYVDNARNIKIGPTSNSNIFLGITENNTFGGSCGFNLFGTYFMGNLAGDYFNQNVTGTQCQLNNFGSTFAENIAGNVSHYQYFKNNTFISNTTKNHFPYGAERNIFENNTDKNLFGYSCRDNKISSYFKSNILPTNLFHENTLSQNFSNNKIPEWHFSNNVTLGLFTNNNLAGGGQYILNVFGAGCRDNTFNGQFNNNTIGQDFWDNQIGINFTNNIFNSSNHSNVIGENFVYNIVGASFKYNTVGNNCNTNEISDGCYGNIIGNYFRGNKIANTSLQYINFTNSTIAYLPYQKEIFLSYNPNAIYISYWQNGVKQLFNVTA